VDVAEVWASLQDQMQDTEPAAPEPSRAEQGSTETPEMKFVLARAGLLADMEPCDLQAYRRAAARMSHFSAELALVLLKEPWFVFSFTNALARTRGDAAAEHPGPQPGRHRTLCRAFVAMIRDMRADPPFDDELFVFQRQILSAQYGLRHFGFKVTATRFGFLSKQKTTPIPDDGAETVTYKLNKYALTEEPAQFLEMLARADAFAEEHGYPACMATPEGVKKFCIALSGQLPRILNLTKAAAKYTVPHAVRKVWLRAEAEQFASDAFRSPAARSAAAWEALYAGMTIDEMQSVCPDSGDYMLRTWSPETTLSEVGSSTGLHPLMVSCWTCLTHDAIRRFGSQVLSITDATAARHLEIFSARFGKATPPNVAELAKACLQAPDLDAAEELD